MTADIVPDPTPPAERVSRAISLLASAPGVLVEVAETKGSTPRERGCWMLVHSAGIINTIGGGHLEFEAIRIARQVLSSGNPRIDHRTIALGPSLGQCCGGVAHLRFECLDCKVGDSGMASSRLAQIAERLSPPLQPVALFGAGHVGHAIVRALMPLPFGIHWIDSRETAFGAFESDRLRREVCEPPQDAVMHIARHSRVLVMSFSHAEDLDIIRCCLLRRRHDPSALPFIGLIGSATKWARFRGQLLARGFSPPELQAVHCPIGIAGIRGKAPEVIAASVAAQLLLDSHAVHTPAGIEASRAKGLPEMAGPP